MDGSAAVIHRSRVSGKTMTTDGGQRYTSGISDVVRNLTRNVVRYPRLTLAVVLLSCGLALLTTQQSLQFRAQRSDLIDPSAAFHQRWLNYTQRFGDTSDIIVVVESDQPATIKRVLDRLGTAFEQHEALFSNALYKIEPGSLRGKGLQYLTPRQLRLGLDRLDGYRPVIAGRWELTQLASLAERLGYQLSARAARDPSADLSSLYAHVERLSLSLQRLIDDDDDFISPWPELLPLDARQQDQARQVVYLLNASGKMGFLKVRPTSDSTTLDGASAAITKLRDIVSRVSTDFPGVRIGATGIPLLEYDEMRRSRADMLWASSISAVVVGLLLWIGFRGLRHPLLALVMLSVGVIWAFGFTTLAVGHLNILSVAFAVILIGLGVDFAIHYLARYLELRQAGRMLRPALLETSSTVGTGIVTAAVTTALAFFCATFTQFLGVAELGLIAAGGILLCALATFVVLPCLIALADRRVEPGRLPILFRGRVLRSITSRHPGVVLAGSAVVAGIVSAGWIDLSNGGISRRVRYDYNLLNLQARGLESVELQRRLFQEADDSLLYAVSMADTPEQARVLRAQFERLPSVHHVEDLAARLPVTRPEKTRLLVQGFHAQLARLPSQVPPLPAADPAVVGSACEGLYAALAEDSDSRLVTARGALDKFLNRFSDLSLPRQIAFLNAFEYRSTTALLRQLQSIAAAADSEPVTVSDLPPELTSRFVSPQGKWLLQVFPKEQIWDIEPLTNFVRDVRSVDPEATGTPLQNFEASQQIMDSYEKAALYALAVIVIVLLIDFLRPELRMVTLLPPVVITALVAFSLAVRGSEIQPSSVAVLYLVFTVSIACILDFRNVCDMLLAMLPPLGGAALMFGVFAYLDVSLNPANLIVLPLVLGIGVDDGVHVVHDYRLQRGRYRMSSSTISAIVLTSLTSMAGFGSLMVASHYGLRSVGLVMVIGVASCLFVSLVPLPAALTIAARFRGAASQRVCDPAHPIAEAVVSSGELPRASLTPDV